MYKIVEESVVNPVHFSITDRVESISSLGSRRKRHLVGLFSTEYFLLSCVLPIEAETGGGGGLGAGSTIFTGYTALRTSWLQNRRE